MTRSLKTKPFDKLRERGIDLAEQLKSIETLDLSDLVKKTELTVLPNLSQRFAADIRLKREDQQQVFSFKIRGAYAKIKSLSTEQRARGVICASAGNHAQGVAVAAQHLGTTAVVVMPIITPDIKVDAVKRLGGEVVLHGENFDASCEYAYQLAEESGHVFVHPYDDKTVIQGQGTIGLEILEASEKTDCVFVPIGGGGLASGIALAVKAKNPNCLVIGVEAEESASMQAAFNAGQPVPLDKVGRFAEGVAVKQVGDETFRICHALLDDIVTVNTDEICAATQDIYEEARVIAEPAGAIALAGIKKHLTSLRTKFDKPMQNVVGMLCGANVNFNRLRYIAERADLGEQKEAILAVTIPERPGSFLEFCHIVGERSITEFNYRYADDSQAHVFVGVALKRGNAEKNELMLALLSAGYGCHDLSGDEVAKTHVRYMVGGRASQAVNEKLYRFSFPEQPGALLGFLQKMQSQWNISLFHYRNHGSDFGRVLLGIQVPDKDALQFTRFLNETGFAYKNESENPAYRLFL